MSIELHHRHDHAAIRFAEELTWASAVALVDTVDTVVDAYFYTRIELIVSSPGGDICGRVELNTAASPSLRFHPTLYYRDAEENFSSFPALVAAVVDAAGNLVGVQRTYLDPGRPAKAKVVHSRKALGRIFGCAVYLGQGGADTLVVAEGIETALALLTARPGLAVAAALSAASLGAFTPPPGVARVLVARDHDPAGENAAERLRTRCHDRGLHAVVIAPDAGDFNDALVESGAAPLAEQLTAALEALHALAEPPPRGGA